MSYSERRMKEKEPKKKPKRYRYELRLHWTKRDLEELKRKGAKVRRLYGNVYTVDGYRVEVLEESSAGSSSNLRRKVEEAERRTEEMHKEAERTKEEMRKTLKIFLSDESGTKHGNYHLYDGYADIVEEHFPELARTLRDVARDEKRHAEEFDRWYRRL